MKSQRQITSSLTIQCHQGSELWLEGALAALRHVGESLRFVSLEMGCFRVTAVYGDELTQLMTLINGRYDMSVIDYKSGYHEH